MVGQSHGVQNMSFLNTTVGIPGRGHGSGDRTYGVSDVLQVSTLLGCYAFGHHLVETVGIDFDIAVEQFQHHTYGSKKNQDGTDDDAAGDLPCFRVGGNGNGRFLYDDHDGSSHTYRPPALPKSAVLYSGAMTWSRYRSLPHRYRFKPCAGYLMSSNSEGSICKASMNSAGLICPGLNRN